MQTDGVRSLWGNSDVLENLDVLENQSLKALYDYQTEGHRAITIQTSDWRLIWHWYDCG